MNNFSYHTILSFIREVFNSNEFIPLHAPVFIGNEKKYIEECIDSTFVSSVGKFVDQFEVEIAKYTGVKKAVACVNGTNGLHLALKLVGVEQDTEVITQPLTFIATANAIAYCNAKPIFLDVDFQTMGLNPDCLLEYLESNTSQKNSSCYNKKTGKRISACLPVHTFGHPCKIDKIIAICKQFNIPVVEDAAESLGSFYRKKHTGSFGDISVISFNGNKTMTTGGGGMLLFNDIKLADYAKHITTQAKVSHSWNFIHDQIGYNYRMPNINAAIGLAQLEKIDFFLNSKRKLATKYIDFFQQNKNFNIHFAKEPDCSVSNYWLNCILFKDSTERDSFLKISNSNGIMTRPAWTLMNKLDMFKDCEIGDISTAIDIENRLVNIPSSVIV